MKNRTMQLAIMPIIAALILLSLARAQQPSATPAEAFTTVAEHVGTALHSQPHRHRLVGISKLLIRGAHPIGSHDVHLALFDIDGEPTSGDRTRLDTALRTGLRPPWQLLSHRTSRFGEKETWVFAHPDGTKVTTVVCLLERGQATLVMADADPQTVLDSLDEKGIVLWSHESVVRGLWGGLGDGSGFGPGIAFTTPSGGVNLVQLHGSAQVTYKSYFKSTLGFRFDPTGGNMQTFSLDLTGRYQVSPDVDFFGVGPNSPAQRAMYNLQERGLRLTLDVRPLRDVQFGGGEDYSGNRVFGGRDDDYANAQTTFSPALVPGLARGANLLSTFGFAQYDTRDYPMSPHRGVYLRLSAADNNGTGNSAYEYWHYAADGRAYVPLTHFSDVLALRALSTWNLAKPGEAVPFFEMARLGDSSILRGYRPYRFYGTNAVASSVEYRHYFTDDFGAFLFGDVGQVYGARSELTRANMRTTWGAGLLFNEGRRKTEFKIYFGITRGEGHRWFLTQGPGF